MQNIRFFPESGFDSWAENQEKLRTVCIFPQIKTDGLPERGCQFIFQRITWLSGRFYFQQYEEYHDQWGDSDDQIIVLLPDDFPAGWTANQLIDTLTLSSSCCIAPKDLEHLRTDRHLLHLLCQPPMPDLFLEVPALGGVFAFSGRDYTGKHPCIQAGQPVEVCIKIAAEAICPKHVPALEALLNQYTNAAETEWLMKQLPPDAMLSEIEIPAPDTALIYFTCPQSGHQRFCAFVDRSSACPPCWNCTFVSPADPSPAST